MFSALALQATPHGEGSVSSLMWLFFCWREPSRLAFHLSWPFNWGSEANREVYSIEYRAKENLGKTPQTLFILGDGIVS